jgi:hypothetical protein
MSKVHDVNASKTALAPGHPPSGHGDGQHQVIVGALRQDSKVSIALAVRRE